MSARPSHAPGMPCWVAVICPDDAEPAKVFYHALFGWEFENIAEQDDPPFHIATLHGDRVASVAGSGNGEPGTWITALSVADREAAAAAVRGAGGSAPENDTVEIASLGRFHRVHDPAGAEIHLVQVDGTVVERADEPGAWTVSCLHVTDRPSVLSFYQTVLGWRSEERGPLTRFGLPGHDVVALLRPSTDAEAVWLPDFRVSDVELATRIATDHGGRVLTAPEDDRPGPAPVLLADPGGARFTISGPPNGV